MKWFLSYAPRLTAYALFMLMALASTAPLWATPRGRIAVDSAPGVFLVSAPETRTLAVRPLVSEAPTVAPIAQPTEPPPPLPEPIVIAAPTAEPQIVYVDRVVYQPPPPQPAPETGNIAPEGCPFPIVNGVCGNGQPTPDYDQEGSRKGRGK